METKHVMKERRSINFFDPEKKIPVESINELLELANLSPSSYNLQPWEVVVVTDPERKEILRKCAFNQAKVSEASAVFIIIANPNAVEENIDDVLKVMVELGYTKPEAAESARKGPFNLYGTKNSRARTIFAVKNASFYAMSVMIAAKDMGYDTHPMDGFDEDLIKKEFNIPGDRIIPLLIALGCPKPDMKLLPRGYRRDIKKFVRYNKYK